MIFEKKNQTIILIKHTFYMNQPHHFYQTITTIITTKTNRWGNFHPSKSPIQDIHL